MRRPVLIKRYLRVVAVELTIDRNLIIAITITAGAEVNASARRHLLVSFNIVQMSETIVEQVLAFPYVFMNLEVFKYFFLPFFFVVLIGIVNGLIFLPVVLSLIGPSALGCCTIDKN